MYIAEHYKKGLTISNRWFAPELMVKEAAAGLYYSHPCATRTVAMGMGAVSGFLKPFLFPVFALVGTVALPIIAAYHYINDYHKPQSDAGSYLAAWSFSLLAVAGMVSYMLLSAYCLPMVASGGLFMLGMTISIAYHVYQAAQAPELPNQT